MKRNFGIQTKLLISFITFSLLIVVFLWLIQVVFLDDIYRSIKCSSIRTATENMSQMNDEELKEYSVEQANNIGLCLSIFDENFSLVSQAHTESQCVIHNVSNDVILSFYRLTGQSEGKYFESQLTAKDLMKVISGSGNQFLFPSYSMGGPDLFFDREPLFDFFSNNDCILFGQIGENDLGQIRFILGSAVLHPVDATVQTIRFELNLAIVIMILMSLAMAFVLSRTISKPISDLNKASKTLPQGVFEGGNISGYREVKELAETLSKSAETISQIDRLRKELISNVSHDLRTPLTLISGYSEAMRDIPGENTPENLQVIIDESRHLSELVTDILDLSKLESGNEKLNLDGVEFVSFIRNILTRFEKFTSTEGYQIEFNSSCQMLNVEADSVKLAQIVYNLVSNAIRFSGEDKFILVRVSEKEGKAYFEVEDHGSGIPENEIEEIWSRYYRVSPESGVSSGTGLGLSIVKKLLVLHKAEFGVKSNLGEGSTFWFSLPLRLDV